MALTSEKTSELRQQIASLNYFHEGIHRHEAETLLLHNGINGTYLLRPNSDNTQYVLSVRYKDSVKHFEVIVDDTSIQFGQMMFNTVTDLQAHFRNKPLLATADGIPVTLQYAYERDVDECPLYANIAWQAESASKTAQPSSLHLGVGTKAGYLEKYGKILKAWKVRWFVLQKAELIIYKNSNSDRPHERVDLSTCAGMIHDDTLSRPHCFRLMLPQRLFGDLILAAQSESDATEWMHLLTFKAHAYT